MKATVYKSLAAIVVAMMGVFVNANAQNDNPLDPTKPKSQVLVGPVIGINRNFHSGGFRVIDEPNCPVFESGTGWGFLAGLTAEFQLGESWSIIPRVTYDSRPGKFEQSLPDVPVLIPSSTGDPTTVNQSVSTTSTITYTLLNAEVMYKQEFWQIGKGVRIAAEAGPVVGYVLGGKNRQVQDLEEPQNARFINPDPTRFAEANGGRELIFFDGDIPGRNSIRFSLKAGLQAEVGLFNNAWIMCPGIYYDLGLTKVTNNENWNLNTLMFQLDFRRAF